MKNIRSNFTHALAANHFGCQGLFMHIMRTILLILLLPLAMSGQNLNKIFLLPNSVTTLINTLLIDQDTIVAFGDVIDVPGHFGLHISKYDTLGNLLDYKTYYHPLGKPYYLGSAAGFIKTSDGGYLGVGDINLGDAIVVFKFSHNGDLEWVKEIADSNLRVLYGFIPVECDEGYFIPGLVQYANYDINGAIFKLNYAGNLVWRKDYGALGPTDLAGNIVKKDDNTFFVSGGQNNNLDVSDPNLWVRSWVFEIDSTGTVMSEWRSEKAEKLSSCLIKLSDEDELVLISVKLQFNPPGIGTSLEFVTRKLDINDWHTVWQSSQIGPESSYFGSWQNLEQNPVDGAWDVVGTYQNYLTGFVMSGITAHINPDNGSTIWLRKDTAYISPVININENRLSGIGHLSSGSIIAGGWVLSTEGGDLHQEAWLLKLSSEGCIEPGDCATVSTHDPGTGHGPSFLNWAVFPNPAKDYTFLVPDKELQGKSGKIELFDQRGSFVREATFTIQLKQPVRVDLMGLPLGLYTYQVLMDNGKAGGGKILVGW